MSGSNHIPRQPQPGERIVLCGRILALERPNGETKAFYLRPGDTVTVQHVPPDDDLLVDVIWSDRVVMVFRKDLLAFGERVMQAGADS